MQQQGGRDAGQPRLYWVNGMEDKNDNTDAVSLRGILGGPVMLAAALIVFLVAAQVSGQNGWMDETNLLALPVVAALGAVVGRISSEHPSARGIDSSILTSSLIAASLVSTLVIPVMISVTFLLVSLGTHVMISRGRPMEANFLAGAVIGLHVAILFASTSSLEEAVSDDSTRSLLAARFSSMWIVMLFGSLYLTLILSRTIDRISEKGMLAELPFDPRNKLAHFSAIAVMVSAIIPMIWLSSISDPDAYEKGAHLGPLWGLFSAAIALFVTFCRSERWNVLASVIALNWIIYTIGRLQDIGVSGFPNALSDSGSYSMILWLLITIWANVGIIMLASRGYIGPMAPLREPSELRRWWQNHNYTILVGTALVAGLVVRVIWNVIPAMNASVIGDWDLSGGSDPWYMKRIIDYVAVERAHLVFDADRNYPVGGLNPRPPLFSWSLALGGILLSWVADMSLSEAVWWSVESQPAIWGALIVLPVAGMARRFHSPLAGIVAAWLIAFMPGHISHSTFGLADHDSFAMFFLTMGFYWWVRAMIDIKQNRLFARTSWNPAYLIAGIRSMWANQRTVMLFATLAGVSFATAGLAWKGFVYAPGIIFLAFSGVAILNLFRGRDTLPITSAMNQMLITSMLIPLPFYIWPGMNLLSDPSGMAPLIYMLGFTLGLGYVISAARDKPWLLVFTMTATLSGAVLAILYTLQAIDLYAGWDILFTGGFYFSKNKVFSTIGEAQAPDRGILFASFGPIVAIAAIGYGLILMWRGGRKENNASFLLGAWIVIASYMSWTAGRFIFNAGPPMAVVGAVGLTSLWIAANPGEFTRHWKKSGIGSPRARFNSTFSASRSRPGVPAVMMILLIVFSQHATYGIDSGIPRGDSSSGDVDETIQGIMPDVLRYEVLGFSVLNSNQYSPDQRCTTGCWYLGTFGPGFNGGGWNMAYDWLANQDTETDFTERPAFLSWWDYGFQALSHGQHPTVADNFQSGIPVTGNTLLSHSQEDVLALMIMNSLRKGGVSDESNQEVLDSYFEENQIRELERIHSMTSEDVEKRSLAIIHSDGEVQLLRGAYLAESGLPSKFGWFVTDQGEIVGERLDNAEDAMALFNDTRGSSSPFSSNPSHYLIGDHRYTPDLVEDFDDLSTGIHRTNARLAVGRAFITHVLDLDQIVDLLGELSSIGWEVQTFQGRIGETVERNTEVRYFAIDDRLYPLGGLFYEDYSYHGGQTTGIFYAPTTLAGLDPEDYISSSYLTKRGDGPIIPRTSGEYEQEYLDDIIRQQSGAITDPNQIISLEDIDYIQQPAFFDTFLARIYVGYGTSTLGLDSGTSGQPGPTWARAGTPGTPLSNSYALPGAMMNHFVIANYHDDGSDYPDEDGNGVPDIYDWSDPRVDPSQYYSAIGTANSNVKIVKYYSGATLEGQVVLESGEPVPNARILVERDAFSAEEQEVDGVIEDSDPRTYWVPIVSEVADDEGRFTATVPAGKIRVSAFYGAVDNTAVRAQIQSGAFEMLSDITREQTDLEDRNINPITAILGGVAGTTYIGASSLMVTGEQGHSGGEEVISTTITVPSATATGQLQWTGETSFNGQPIANATVVLKPSDPEASHQGYSISTSSGSIEGEGLYFQGDGTATFNGPGSFESPLPATAVEFTGTLSQTLRNNQSVTGTGTFEGKGTFVGELDSDDPANQCTENGTIPDGEQKCMLDSTTFLLDGMFNGTGKFVSDGQSLFIRHYSDATFTAAGKFDVDADGDGPYGTITGDGTFQGDGTFSGPMVSEGTFHLSGAIPGDYAVEVLLNSGQSIQVDTPFTIPRSATSGTRSVDVTGISLNMIVSDEDGSPAEGTITLRDSEALDSTPSDACSDSNLAPCTVTIGDGGTVSIGPIPSMPHTVSYDADSDGFDDLVVDVLPEEATSGIVSIDATVPVKYDVSLTILSSDEEEIPGLNLQITNQIDSSTYGLVYSASSSTYNAEVPPGEYILNHTLDNTQLWERFDLQSDMEDTFRFKVSSILSGTVFVADDDQDPLPEDFVQYAQVIARWSGFETTTLTDDDGNYEFTLPVGESVTVTVVVGLNNLVDGEVVEIMNENPDLDLVARKGSTYEGVVTVNRPNYLYTSSLLGWEPLSIIASNDSTDVTWVSRVGSDGLFEIALPTGEWSIQVLESDYPSTAASTTLGEMIELTINPQNATLDLFAFIDNSRDGVSDNGTGVSVEFNIVALTNDGLGANLTTSNDGTGSVDLEPGSYRIDTTVLNADQTLFGTRILTGQTSFEINLDGSSVERSIGFDPEGVVNITVLDQTLSPVSDLEVRFRNIDRQLEFISTLTTDENGSILALLPDGSTIIEIEGYEPGDGSVLGARIAVDVSAGDPAVVRTIELTEMAWVNLTVTDDLRADGSQGLKLILDSNDGIGTVQMPITNESGGTSAMVVPGSWNISYDVEDQGVRLTIEETTIGDVLAGESIDVSLNANREAKLSGKVFWDFDKDGGADVAEGVANASISITGNDIDIELVADEDGRYSTMLPYNSSVSISVQKDGFSDATQDASVMGFPVESDIQLTAGTVTASGSVNYLGNSINPDWSDDVEIILVPKDGFAAPQVHAVKGGVDSWDGTWSVDLEPGRYILQVRDTSRNLVAFSEIFADLVDGGSADVDLTPGGWLLLSGSWLDYDGNLHSLSSSDLDLSEADVTDQELSLLISSDSSLEWRMSIPEDGDVRALMPAGPISISGDFTVDQKDRIMSYEAGQTVLIPSSTISDSIETAPVDLRFTRISNSSMSAMMTSSDSATVDEDGVLFALPNLTDGYEPMTVQIELDYEGHESSDVFTLSAIVPGTDGPSWTVEFDNGSGVYSETSTVTLSIDDDEASITAKITPPNASVARHFPNARTISVQASTDSGVSENVQIKVNVPKTSGWSLATPPEELYGVKPGSQTSVSLAFSNDGNADDVFSLSFDDDALPPGWTRTGAQTITMGAFEMQSASIVLNAPSDSEGQSFTLVMYVVGDDQTEYPPVEIDVSAEYPDLNIDEDTISWMSGGIDPVFGSMQTVVLTIENDGLVPAEEVVIRADHKTSVNSEFSGINATAVVSVPAGGESVAYLDLNFTDLTQGEAWIVFSIESVDGQLSDEKHEKKYNLLSPAVEDASNATQVLMVILIIFLGGLLIMLTRRPGRRPNAPF
mgnify:FL=1